MLSWPGCRGRPLDRVNTYKHLRDAHGPRSQRATKRICTMCTEISRTAHGKLTSTLSGAKYVTPLRT